MWKVRQLSEPTDVVAVNTKQAPEAFTPKYLTYEVSGSLGSGGTLDYTDVDGRPHEVSITSLPWSHTETTTLTVVSGSISVRVKGGQVGCRMLVNGVVKDEKTAVRKGPDVMCRVKSA